MIVTSFACATMDIKILKTRRGTFFVIFPRWEKVRLQNLRYTCGPPPLMRSHAVLCIAI
jgi:hypothetical protein